MKREVEYQKCFNVVSEINFGDLLTDGDRVVTIRRYYPDGIFDTETIVCFVGWDDWGALAISYNECTEEEISTIREMMDSIQEKGSW